MSPLRFVTLPQRHTASPSEVASSVLLCSTEDGRSPIGELSVMEWEEEVGGVTSRTRAGLPQDGPKPIRQEVKDCM